MSVFSSFILLLGSFMLAAGLIAAWMFRGSTAPLWTKIIVPAVLTILACATPFEVRAIMGFPVDADLRSLPERAELLAFFAKDDDKLVDLWMKHGDSPPRAYEVVLDAKLKQTLREAQNKLGHGSRVMLKKKGVKGRERPGMSDIDGGPAPYQLDDSAYALPNKDQ